MVQDSNLQRMVNSNRNLSSEQLEILERIKKRNHGKDFKVFHFSDGYYVRFCDHIGTGKPSYLYFSWEKIE